MGIDIALILTWQSWQHFFGSWPNVMQGVGGAVIAVGGAYTVAVYTSRNELRRDRQRAREDAGFESAGRLIAAMADVPEGVRAVKKLQPASGSGIDYKHVIAWKKRRATIQEEIKQCGVLIPPELERRSTSRRRIARR